MHPTKTLILRFLEKNPNQTIRRVSEEIGVGYTHTGVLLRQLWKKGCVTESFTANKSYWRIRHAKHGTKKVC
jgi:hypothetical protein